MRISEAVAKKFVGDHPERVPCNATKTDNSAQTKPRSRGFLRRMERAVRKTKAAPNANRAGWAMGVQPAYRGSTIGNSNEAAASYWPKRPTHATRAACRKIRPSRTISRRVTMGLSLMKERAM